MGEALNPTHQGSAALEEAPIATLPVAALNGVTAAQSAALQTLSIATVFDLAMSPVFNAAQELVAISESADATERQLGLLSSSLIDTGAAQTIDDLATRSPSILRNVGDTTVELFQTVFGIETLLDLARWPPFRAARQVLGLSGDLANSFLDPGVPAELVPTLARHTTEKYSYSKFVIHDQDTPAADDVALDITAVSLDPAAAWTVAGTQPDLHVGAHLAFEQAWTPLALALGNVLHSVALAPGESTNIAVVDWSRRERFASVEDVSEADHLQNLQSRSRTLHEVTSAVAQETLLGSSTTDSTAASETTASSGQGFSSGASQSSASKNNVVTATTASTSGQREMSTAMAQSINDATSQHAASARNRRATVVREALQSESETLTTRNITNYNHMHALSIEYFEVVQIYQVVAALTRITPCLFVPYKPISDWTPAILDRFHPHLAAAALAPGIRSALVYPVVRIEVRSALRDAEFIQNASPLFREARKRPNRKVDGTAKLLAITLHDVHDEAPLLVQRDGVTFRITMNDGGTVKDWAPNTNQTPLPLTDIAAINLVLGRDGLSTVRVLPSETTLIAALRISEPEQDRSFTMPVIFDITRDAVSGSDKDGVLLATVRDAHYPDAVLQHFEENTRRYNAAILEGLPPGSFARLLECYRLGDVPLPDLVDPTPLANTGTHLVFRLIEPDGSPVADKVTALRGRILGARSDEFTKNGRLTLDERRLPMATGGTFVEAVQGRANSAEKIDLTRWWNWQESPIPLSPPEIEALTGKSRRRQIDLTAGGLSSALVQLTEAGELPAPESLSALVTALGNAELFDDLAGLDEAIAAAQTALTQAVSLANQTGEQSAENLAAGLKITADAVDKMVGIVTKFTTTLVSAGLSGAGLPAPTAGGSGTGGADDGAGTAGSPDAGSGGAAGDGGAIDV